MAGMHNGNNDKENAGSFANNSKMIMESSANPTGAPGTGTNPVVKEEPMDYQNNPQVRAVFHIDFEIKDVQDRSHQ